MSGLFEQLLYKQNSNYGLKGDVMSEHLGHQMVFKAKRCLLHVLVVLMVVGTSGLMHANGSFAVAASLPAKCLPITGPNHGAGTQYEVHFKLLRTCDEAVALFREIVGKTPPERPNNSPRLWWDGTPGWICEAGNGGRPVIATYCESGDKGLAFNPIPASLASPTTILIGQIATDVEAQNFIEGSSATDETCVVPGPSVSVRGRTYTKWMLTMKNDSSSALGCSFVESWLSRMLRQNGRGPRVALATAPRGWKCYGTTSGVKAILGVCKKNGSTATFGWSPVPNNN